LSNILPGNIAELWANGVCLHSPGLDSVMQEQVVIPMDEDVTVPPPQHEHPDTLWDYNF